PDGRVGADPEREREHRGGGEPRASSKAAQGVGEVEPYRPEELLDPRGARVAAIDATLLRRGALHVAELGERSSAGVVAADPESHEVVGARVDVKLQLDVD